MYLGQINKFLLVGSAFTSLAILRPEAELIDDETDASNSFKRSMLKNMQIYIRDIF
jgi:hypothetical protein